MRCLSVFLLSCSATVALDVQGRKQFRQGQSRGNTTALSLEFIEQAQSESGLSFAAQRLADMDIFGGEFEQQPLSPCAKRPNFTAKAAMMTVFFGAIYAAVAWGLNFLSTPAGDASAGGGGRCAILDNAKFLLMVAVILGHFSISVEYVDKWPWVTEVRRFVQFHVLTYCFISGLVSRSSISARAVKSLMVGVLAPWVLNALVLAPLMTHMVYNTPAPTLLQYYRTAKDTIIHPGVAWYLPCLVLWRFWGWAIMPLEKVPGARLALALLFSAVTGYMHLEAEPLPWLERATAFFPVFVLGQVFPLDWVLARLELNAKTLAAGVAVLAAIFMFEFTLKGGFFVDALPHFGWGRINFCGPEQAHWYWIRQIGRHTIELSKGLALLFLCTPRQQCFMTMLGRYSLYTYLLHWYLVVDLRKQLFALPPSDSPTVMVCGWLAALAAAVVINVVFASEPMRAIFWPVLEPVWLEGRTPWDAPKPVKK